MSHWIITSSSKFKKQHNKLPNNIQRKFQERVYLMVQDVHHPLLRTHALSGKYKGYWTINITGDYRAIFQHTTNNHLRFIRIGTHAQLYKN